LDIGGSHSVVTPSGDAPVTIWANTVLNVLRQFVDFQTTEACARSLAERAGTSLELSRQLVERAVSEKLMVDWSELTGSTQSSKPDQVIDRLGVVTANRPSALARCLESHSPYASAYNRDLRVVVCDDSTDAQSVRSNRQLLKDFSDAHQVTVAYWGLSEKQTLIDMLQKDLHVDRETIAFGLSRHPEASLGIGANRNAMLLACAGHRVLCVDDDTLGTALRTPYTDGIFCSAGRDPRALQVFADDVDISTLFQAQSGLLNAHNQILGTSVRSLIKDVKDATSMKFSEHADTVVARLIGENPARVRLTSSGIAGDCGWGSPFGFWNGPMGYLLSEGAFFDTQIQESEAAYQQALTQRNVLHAVKQTTVCDATSLMSLFLGVDLSGTLPPFLPMQRGEDLVFAFLAWHCVPDLVVAHVPCAAPHKPVTQRRFARGELFRNCAVTDFARLTLECLRVAVPDIVAADPATNIKRTAVALKSIACLSDADFDDVVRQQLAKSLAGFIQLCETRIFAAGSSAPSYWVNDIRKYWSAVQAASRKDTFASPIDLAFDFDLSAAKTLAKTLLRRFADFLEVWPDMLAFAAKTDMSFAVSV